MMTVRRFFKLYNVVVYRISANPMMSFRELDPAPPSRASPRIGGRAIDGGGGGGGTKDAEDPADFTAVAFEFRRQPQTT
uniref:Uncharacterized protein n=1 Tax=Plectus sambesii TaxID=2011161 RepID=A0A914VPZ5_9BILA